MDVFWVGGVVFQILIEILRFLIGFLVETIGVVKVAPLVYSDIQEVDGIY